MWKIDKGKTSGTTTDAYVSSLTWNCAELREKTIHLFNNHATASLYYKLLGRYSGEQTPGREDILVNEISLAAGEDARFQYSNQYEQLILQVKNNSAVASYEINYIGQGA
jgi:hypothetical protein